MLHWFIYVGFQHFSNKALAGQFPLIQPFLAVVHPKGYVIVAWPDVTLLLKSFSIQDQFR